MCKFNATPIQLCFISKFIDQSKRNTIMILQEQQAYRSMVENRKLREDLIYNKVVQQINWKEHDV